MTSRALLSADDDGTASRPRLWPWLVGLFCMFAATLGVVSLAFFQQAGVVRADLVSAQTKLSYVPSIASGGDMDGLQQVAGEVTELTARANVSVQGPLWKIAEGVPFIGENVAATQTATEVAEVLTQEALPVVIDILKTLRPDQLALEGGGFNLEPFRQVQSSIPVIREALSGAATQIAEVDRTGLMQEVREPLDQLVEISTLATPALETVEKYLPTFLDMAGAQAPKSYLLIFQNNAEIRATGGNPAASMVITVANGAVQLSDQASAETFYDRDTIGETYTALPAETLSLYRETLTQYSQDYTMTPDFPTTARLFQDLWMVTTGGTFDGVISLDPVVLSHMLEVAGPVQLADGETISSENATKALLSDSYERFPADGDASDAYFANVASTVFNKLVAGGWDTIGMLQAIVQSVEEQRIYLSFADPMAQALAVEFGVDGALRESTDVKTQVGLYLVDSSVGKLEYHLTTAVSATCDAAARTISVSSTLTNSIPDSISAQYTLGFRNASFGIPSTSMMLDVLFFAPPGATILSTDPAEGDVAEWQRWGIEKGNSALSKTIFVPKGETRTVSYTTQLGEGLLGPLELRYSPTVNPTVVTVDSSCDTLFPPAPEVPNLLGDLEPES